MLSGSGELQEYIKRGGVFKSKANLTLTDGTIIELTPSEFLIGNGFNIESATSNRSTFDIGAVIPKKLTMKLINYEGQLNTYDFESAYVTNTEVFATLPSGSTESVKKGQFKVDKQVFNGGIVTLTCYDKLAELDTLYSGAYTEQTALEFCQYIASKLGISLNVTNFNNRTMPFIMPQESYTDRQLLNYVLQATCNFAYIDVNNQLVIRWYDLATLDVADDLINAGTFKLPSTDIYDAGEFADMSDSQNVVDAGTFTDISRRLNIETVFGSPTVDVDNVVITGVIVKDIDGNEYVSGTKAYAITIDSNPLIKGREQEVSKAVADIVVGMTFRPMNITTLNNPLIEVGDVATVVIDNNPYATIFTNVTYGIGRRSKLICGAESPGKNSAIRNTEANKVYIQSKEYTNTKVETAISSYDKAIQDLTTLISQSFGAFKTEEKQADGSVIYYMHNKPSLSDSNIRWKMTSDGLAVSTDYGKTWNAGIDANGNTVVNFLVATGATIGGLKLTQDSIYSGEKKDVSNTDDGFYLDKNGQMNIGNVNSYIKSYISNGTRHMDIKADAISFTSGTDIESAINETQSATSKAVDTANNACKTASAANSNLAILDNKVASNVTETANLKTRISVVEQTANGLSVRLTDVESDITTAQSTANNAVTAASKAQSTADTAKTNAATAQSTANTAQTEAANAAKTATNFLGYDSSGLTVGNKTSGSWSGTRTKITSAAFQVLNSASTVLSSFGASLIELGKNSTNAIISLCGGKGTISYKTSVFDKAHTELAIESTRISMIGNPDTSVGFCHNSTDGNQIGAYTYTAAWGVGMKAHLNIDGYSAYGSMDIDLDTENMSSTMYGSADSIHFDSTSYEINSPFVNINGDLTANNLLQYAESGQHSFRISSVGTYNYTFDIGFTFTKIKSVTISRYGVNDSYSSVLTLYKWSVSGNKITVTVVTNQAEMYNVWFNILYI